MTTVKGLLKGLRYISQIFDNEKEEEMQIGFPTDVKHVAHVGMDGPSANKPSWMNEYSTTSETEPVSSISEAKKKSHKSSSQDPILTRDLTDIQMSPRATSDSPPRHSSKTKQSRRSSGPVGSPSRHSMGHEKPRRHKHSGDIGSPARDPSNLGRRSEDSNLGSESPSQDPHGLPKSRRKKSKGSSGGGSNRSSRSKGPDQLTESFSSDPGSGYGLKNSSVLKVYEEGNECDEISRGIRAL